ncbi:hypothetical protein, partial [Stenotrophomonas sp.]
MTHDAGPDRPGGAGNGNLRALLWFVVDGVVTVLFTAALWQASYAKGDDGMGPSWFVVVMPPMLLLFVNGFRRVVCNYHRMTFQGVPLVQCVVALWVAVMFYLLAWSVDSTGWGATIVPIFVYVAAYPLAVCTGLLYALLDALLRRAVRMTPVIAVEASDDPHASVAQRVSSSMTAGPSFQRYSLTRRARRRDSIQHIPARQETDLHAHASGEPGSSAEKTTSASQSNGRGASLQGYLWTGVVLLLIAGTAMYDRPSTVAVDDKVASRRFSTNLTSMDYEPTDTFVQPVYVDG